MTESRTYINEIENEQTIIMNPNILPTQEEWQLVCKMVKQHELTDKEIEDVWIETGVCWDVKLTDMIKISKAILKKAKNDI